MATTVLNSAEAVKMSLFIIRAFVKTRARTRPPMRQSLESDVYVQRRF